MVAFSTQELALDENITAMYPCDLMCAVIMVVVDTLGPSRSAS